MVSYLLHPFAFLCLCSLLALFYCMDVSVGVGMSVGVSFAPPVCCVQLPSSSASSDSSESAQSVSECSSPTEKVTPNWLSAHQHHFLLAPSWIMAASCWIFPPLSDPSCVPFVSVVYYLHCVAFCLFFFSQPCCVASFIHDLFLFFFRYVFVIHPLHHAQLSNGYDHYGPAEASYPSGVAFPFPPNPSSSSSSTSYSSSTLRSWSRPCSALMPDYPHYSTLNPGMLPPSSKIPSWKVRPAIFFLPSLHHNHSPWLEVHWDGNTDSHWFTVSHKFIHTDSHWLTVTQIHSHWFTIIYRVTLIYWFTLTHRVILIWFTDSLNCTGLESHTNV